MILTAALVLMAQADARGWVQIARDQQQTDYVDVGSLRHLGSRTMLRHRAELRTPLPSGAVTAEYVVEISCDRQTIGLWGGVERNQAGEVVRFRKYPQPRVHAVNPDSVANRLIRFACER